MNNTTELQDKLLQVGLISEKDIIINQKQEDRYKNRFRYFASIGLLTRQQVIQRKRSTKHLDRLLSLALNSLQTFLSTEINFYN